MHEPNPAQQEYLDSATRKAKPRRCRCGAAATPHRARGLLWGPSADALSTTVEYRCPSCGRRFRIGLMGDAVGCLIIGAIAGRVRLESFFFGVFLVPLALLLVVVALNKIRLRHPVAKTPMA